MSACEDHPFDLASGTCAECRRTFCSACLVHPHGPRQPPFCIPCALTVSGVRRTAARPPLVGRSRPRGRSSGPVTVARVALGLALAGGTGVAGLSIFNALG